MNPQQLVQSVLYLPAITRESVGQAIGVTLQEQVAKESPTTKFFRSDAEGGFSLVTFQFAKKEPVWVLNCIYDLERSRHPASSIAWNTFGPCIREDLLPTMGPEGCSAHEFSYSGVLITFFITAQSKLVHSVMLTQL